MSKKLDITPQQLAGAMASMGEVIGPAYFGPMELMDLIQVAQLALRHPQLPYDQRNRVEASLVRLSAWFWTQDQSGVIKEVLQAGFDKQHDVPSQPSRSEAHDETDYSPN